MTGDASVRAVRRRWRLLPTGFAAQLALVVIAASLLVQGATFLIVADDRRLAIEAVRRDQTLTRVRTIVELLAVTPPALHDQVVLAGSSGATRLWLATRASVPVPMRPFDLRLARSLQARLGALVQEVRVARQRPPPLGWRPAWDHEADADDQQGPAALAADGGDTPGAPAPAARDAPRESNPGPRGPGSRRPPVRPFLEVSLALPDGRWLNGRTVLLPVPVAPAIPALAATLGTALVAVMASLLMLRRLTRPLRRLAEATDRLGRGEDFPALPTEGPLEIRRTVAAFELMRDRLRSYVADRTRMLAALGHDLRTPITTLRLRAEMVEDGETRDRLVATLDEMDRMVEASLTFTREAGSSEPTRVVDLGALVESVCADLVDLGREISVRSTTRIALPCRPVGLRRAVRNLVGNAVTYGQRARVAVTLAGDHAVVTIEDDGPGIAEADLERAFEPFTRLAPRDEGSQSGIGLGLAIARTIARSHGGEVRLANRPGGGLVASLSLPLPGAARTGSAAASPRDAPPGA